MLTIEKLNFSYGDLQVIWNLDLKVNQGEIVTVVGANGAGKSTMLKNISRLVKPASGRIVFDGENLRGLESHQVVERGIVQVPEGRKIFPRDDRSGKSSHGIVQSRRPVRTGMPTSSGSSALFPRLKEREKQLGGTMSGGEQQMLAIGRGLMANPRLLLLDEPSLGLSPLFVKIIFGNHSRDQPARGHNPSG